MLKGVKQNKAKCKFIKLNDAHNNGKQMKMNNI